MAGRPPGSKNKPKTTQKSDNGRKTSTSLKDAKFIALYISALGIAVYLLILGLYSGELYGGLDSSHTEGVDYKEHGYYLLVGSLIFLASFLLSIYAVGKAQGGSIIPTIGITVIVGFFFFMMAANGLYYARAYKDNAEVDDIALRTNAGVEQAQLDLGNVTVLSASVEEYHVKDDDSWWYKYFRLITFEDKWRITVRINNSAYWNSTYQNLTGTTARVKAFTSPKAGSTVYGEHTGWIAPNTQPGAVDSGDISILVFEGIQRSPRVSYFHFQVLDSDGTVLGESYIHPRIELSENAWFMDTSI